MDKLYGAMLAATCTLVAYTGFTLHVIWLGVIATIGAIIEVLLLFFEGTKR